MTAPDLIAAAHRPVTKLLDRLEGIRDRGEGQWLACCPAHQDRNPSLSIKETSDGTVLLRCWAGCDVGSIMAAVNLELSDLFPRTEHAGRRHRDQHRLSPRDALTIIKAEVYVVQIAGNRLLRGDELTVADVDRLNAAVERLNAVVVNVYG